MIHLHLHRQLHLPQHLRHPFYLPHLFCQRHYYYYLVMLRCFPVLLLPQLELVLTILLELVEQQLGLIRLMMRQLHFKLRRPHP